MSTEATAVIGQEYENIKMRTLGHVLRVIVRDIRAVQDRKGVQGTDVNFEIVSAPDFMEHQVGQRPTRTLPEFLELYDDDLDYRPPVVVITTTPTATVTLAGDGALVVRVAAPDSAPDQRVRFLVNDVPVFDSAG